MWFPLSVEQLVKRSVMGNHTPQYPVKITITTWEPLSPPRGLQLSPSCQARCPVKTSNESISAPTYSKLVDWKKGLLA